jgi:hypothetical protein
MEEKKNNEDKKRKKQVETYVVKVRYEVF